MPLLRIENWLKSPLDRDVIARWTVGAGQGMNYTVQLPEPVDPKRFTFLALGDTGDSEAAGPLVSPQDAVAGEMGRDAALPGSPGDASLIVHLGDVVYMTGERRLYDRNFRRPYAPFLGPQSTVDNLVFRLPFLPVPGNHDYYDLVGWVRWLTRLPLLGAGLRAIAHELFAFSLPEGGSEMGKAYMQAFVEAEADTRLAALAYRPGEYTRLPNRYYQFQHGTVDFFALDSNTLDAPPPWADKAQVHAEAARRLQSLEARAQELDRHLRRHQLALEQWRHAAHRRISADPVRREALLHAGRQVSQALADLHAAGPRLPASVSSCREAGAAVVPAERRWEEGTHDLAAAQEPEAVLEALRLLEEASDEGCTALIAAESCLAVLPEGEERSRLLAARDALQQALSQWSEIVAHTPAPETAVLHQLSEEALDVQRELALERRRLRYRPEDYDSAQLQWLEHSLALSAKERPDNWRIVYLHHPLYTSITNHCERPDVQGLRANLLTLLQNRVHLVLSGHAHTFEWFRSDLLPQSGLFVTGGGGQVSLRPSLLEPSRRSRHRRRFQDFCAGGITEGAVGGQGPAAADGEAGLLYHYLRIEVTPEALWVRPVGVRRLAEGYRREEPMPVYHAAQVAAGRPTWQPRRLEAVVIGRNASPQPLWV